MLLSGEPRRELKNLKKFDNEVQVLIFKQSIALGWDCPGAQIIVTLRHWNNVTFSIQVLGRIMRYRNLKWVIMMMKNLTLVTFIQTISLMK